MKQKFTLPYLELLNIENDLIITGSVGFGQDDDGEMGDDFIWVKPNN